MKSAKRIRASGMASHEEVVVGLDSKQTSFVIRVKDSLGTRPPFPEKLDEEEEARRSEVSKSRECEASFPSEGLSEGLGRVWKVKWKVRVRRAVRRVWMEKSKEDSEKQVTPRVTRRTKQHRVTAPEEAANLRNSRAATRIHRVTGHHRRTTLCAVLDRPHSQNTRATPRLPCRLAHRKNLPPRHHQRFCKPMCRHNHRPTSKSPMQTLTSLNPF
ncbi:hypothetical protein ACSQ67_023840 [Phaseolus vulgaris]